MKKLSLFNFKGAALNFSVIAGGLLSIGLNATAQDKTQGKVEYEVSINVHANLKPDQEAIKEMIPETITRTTELLFKDNYARLKDQGNESENMMQSSDGGNVVSKVIIMGADGDADAVTYIDMETKKTYRLCKIKDKKYLVSQGETEPGKAPAAPVESGDTKKILGYTCYKIVTKDNGQTTTIWYTKDIPVLGSAVGMLTDQGLVLAMESKAMSFVAKSIKFEKQSDSEVKPPKDLEKITQKEFVKRGGQNVMFDMSM